MTEKRKVLGRGLDTLLPSRPPAHPHPPAAGHAPAAAPAQAPGEAVQQIPVGQIDPNPYQTRLSADPNALDEMAASVRATGVLQPITVRPGENGRFQLIAGHRRWLASKMAQRPTVPAIVRRVSNEQAMEMTIIENLQREDLNPTRTGLGLRSPGARVRPHPGADRPAHRQGPLLDLQLPAPAAPAGRGADDGGAGPDSASVTPRR